MQKFLEKREVMSFSFIEKPRKKDFVMWEKKEYEMYQVLPNGIRHGRYISSKQDQKETKNFRMGTLSGLWVAKTLGAKITGVFVNGKISGKLEIRGSIPSDICIVYDERGLPISCKSEYFETRMMWDLERKMLITKRTSRSSSEEVRVFSDVCFTKEIDENLTFGMYLNALFAFECILLSNGFKMTAATFGNSRVSIRIPVYV
ncbi:hypothetical protein [Brazilian marseillevirus]|uniref:hypothetical protein n=1 Tax=Brazilian marseillevirus TaxID=1813599 RepID=UPI0007839F96|nr:hypothetical protein A3303_gp184 [Brazilian marseillevirus]AMQ10692.1 hypothetical protein [Brazilian marseillevirus]